MKIRPSISSSGGIEMKKLIAVLLAACFAVSVPGTAPAESVPETVLPFEQQEGIASRMSWTVYTASGPVEDYRRGPKELVEMPAGEDYTRLRFGVLTFRGNAFRRNASAGTVPTPSSLNVIWEAETGFPEWTGQPVIIKWSAEVRADSDLYEEKKNKPALKEVVVPCADGSLFFCDLEDGQPTRGILPLGAPAAGTACASPSGLPYLGTAVRSDAPAYRQYNLYTQEELAALPETSGAGPDRVLFGSPVIDRISDTLITAGDDGLLYLVSFNTYFSWQDAEYRIAPSVTAMKSIAAGEDESLTAVRSPVAVYNRYVFYADMAGILRCVDTNTLSPVWMAENGDSVVSAVALDLQGDELALYAATVLNIRESGAAQARRFNALNGEETWCLDIGVDRRGDGTYAGFAASPMIGTGGLDDLAFFTVTGLNEEGRGTLGLPGDTEAAVIALEKKTGAVRWARPFTDRCVSSPVGIYGEDGNGWIIQCTERGTVVLLDGLTGVETASLAVDGQILASPAVYSNIMVICTASGGTGKVCGIRIEPAD